MSMRIALVHDYVTQRGGAERVALAMTRAFPGAPLYTSLYQPATTFPEFAAVDVRPTGLNAVSLLRRKHRLALPVLAPVFSLSRVDADVVLCSSSGWAHGVRTDGRKIVYCHAPARWLYQPHRYAERWSPSDVARRVMRSPLEAWDRRAAHSATRYLANSTAVAAQIAALYGVTAHVAPRP